MAKLEVNSRSPQNIDICIGERIRLRRSLLGMSQEALGEALGISFQQVQKYERGANRVSASRLYQIALILDVPVAFFFEGIPESYTPGMGEELEVSDFENGFDPLAEKETLDLIRVYYRIEDLAVRRQVLRLLKTMTASGDLDGDADLDTEIED